MGNTKASGKSNIGHLIDSIWTRLDANHELNLLRTDTTEYPHERLLKMGQVVLKVCGRSADDHSLPDDEERDVWLRLLGAWVTLQKQHSMTRSDAAVRIGMDASNLTNFINGKRPLTTNAVNGFAKLFELQTFDLRPAQGAAYARKAEEHFQSRASNAIKIVSRLEDKIERNTNYNKPDLLKELNEIRATLQG